MQSLQTLLAELCAYIGGPWGLLVGLDFLLLKQASKFTRDVFLFEVAHFRKTLAAAMRKAEIRTAQLGPCIKQRLLDPQNSLVDRRKCELLCLKERQQPKRMTEVDWFIYDFCIPQKYKLRFLPKSRGQIYGPMGN